MSERGFLPRLSRTRAPIERNQSGRLTAAASARRTRSGSPLALVGILAVAGWFIPGRTLAGVGWTTLGLDGDFVTALAMDPSNPATLYADADGEGVFKSTDGGGNWVALGNGLTDLNFTALAIDPRTPTTLYTSTAFGVFKTTDGGIRWTAIDHGLTNPDIFALAIDGSSTATLYAGDYGGGVFKSTDGGLGWTAIDNGLTDLNVLALAIDPATPSTVYAGTSSGVFKTTDRGASWSTSSSGPNDTVNALAIDHGSPSIVYAGTVFSGVFKTTNHGASWTAVNKGLSDLDVTALAIDPTTTSTVYAATFSSGVFRSTDGGGNWAAINNGLTDLSVTALAIGTSGSSTVYAGTVSGLFVLGNPPNATCEPGAADLCLGASRFTVEATWSTADGGTGRGQAVALTDDTGYFWFFDSTNVEIMTKVVNGCGVNGHFWVFAAGLTNVQAQLTVRDTATGAVVSYMNPQNTAFSPVQDTSALVCGSPAPVPKPRVPSPATASTVHARSASAAAPAVCDSSDVTTLCLNADRFSVKALWQTPDGKTGVGQAVSITSDTGYFWFFDAGSVEVLVKVLDGCDLNKRFWVFAAGLTNVAVTLTVTDVITGQARTYHNHQDRAFAPLQDTSALAACLPACDSKNLTVDEVTQATNLSGQGLSDPFGSDLNLLANRFMALEGCSLQSASSSSLRSSRTTARHDDTCNSTQCDGCQYCGAGNSCDGIPFHSFLKLLTPSHDLNKACFDHDTCYTANCVPNGCFFDYSSRTTTCDDKLFSTCASLLLDGCRVTTDCFICAAATLASLRPASATPPQCQVAPCTSQFVQVCNTSTGTCTGVSIEPTEQFFPSNGGSAGVTVRAPSGELWMAVSNDEWITITSGRSGTGTGMAQTVLYSVGANTGAGDRMGTMTIAGLTFTVTQQAGGGSSSGSFAGSYSGSYATTDPGSSPALPPSGPVAFTIAGPDSAGLYTVNVTQPSLAGADANFFPGNGNDSFKYGNTDCLFQGDIAVSAGSPTMGMGTWLCNAVGGPMPHSGSVGTWNAVKQ
jgi:photosystem II stability/assembly factor-like uncharacterized protein